jgi:hypothetical protein
VPAAQYREEVPVVTAEAFIVSEKTNEVERSNIEKHPRTKSENLRFVIIPEIIAVLYLRTSLRYFCISKK